MPTPSRHPHRRLSTITLTLHPMTRLATQAKGKSFRKVIAGTVRDGREYYLHATKGYRSVRA